jgi:hypothetical protein
VQDQVVLPEHLGLLTNLQVLDVAENHLTTLPIEASTCLHACTHVCLHIFVQIFMLTCSIHIDAHVHMCPWEYCVRQYASYTRVHMQTHTYTAPNAYIHSAYANKYIHCSSCEVIWTWTSLNIHTHTCMPAFQLNILESTFQHLNLEKGPWRCVRMHTHLRTRTQTYMDCQWAESI